MNIIVAVNSDWGIGYNNTQSIVIPEDRKNFTRITNSGTVIAGRKTFEDFGVPLPNRKNIILTHDRNFKVRGIIAAHSVDEVLAMVSDDEADKVFVIGGGSVYSQFLPLCSCAFITKIEASPPSDTYFPNLDKMPGWFQESHGETRVSLGIHYSFDFYRNNATASPDYYLSDR